MKHIAGYISTEITIRTECRSLRHIARKSNIINGMYETSARSRALKAGCAEGHELFPGFVPQGEARRAQATSQRLRGADP
jgi:hypothetical protein